MTRSSYQWNSESSLIKEVEIDDHGKKPVGVIFAPENSAEPEKLAHLQSDLFVKHGILGYAKQIDGRQALVVHEFDTPESLIDTLETQGVVAGKPEVTQLPPSQQEQEEKTGLGKAFEDFRHKGAMKAAGVAGIMGHLLLLTSGHLEQDPEKQKIAGIFLLNTALYAYYGNGTQDLQADEALQPMRDMLKENGIDLKSNTLEEVVDQIATDKGFLSKIDNFVREHIVQLNESVGAYNNYLMIQNGLGQKDFGMLGAGVSSLLGSLSAIAVPEKPMEDQPKEMLDNPLGKAWAFVQDSPMRVMGVMNLINSTSLMADIPKRFNLVKNKETLLGEKLQAESDAYTDLSNAGLQAATHSEQANQWLREPKVSAEAIKNAHTQPDGAATPPEWPNADSYTKEAHAAGIKEEVEGIGKARENLASAQKDIRIMEGGDKMWMIPTGMAVAYTAANILFSISSKNAGKATDPATAHEELISRAAQSVLQVDDPIQQERAIDLMGMALGGDKHVDAKGEDMAAYIRHKRDEIAANPFIEESLLKQKERNNIVPFDSDGLARQQEQQHGAFSHEQPSDASPETTVLSRTHDRNRLMTAPEMAVTPS